MQHYSSRLLQILDATWADVRYFAYRNRTIFEAFFIIIYTLEQAALIWLTHASPEDIELIISVFALAVLTTFSLHKLVMESRIKLLENDVSGLHAEVNSLAQETEKVNKRNSELYSALLPKKSLYTSKTPKSQRGDAHG
jgi:hypothetical protein